MLSNLSFVIECGGKKGIGKGEGRGKKRRKQHKMGNKKTNANVFHYLSM
jgi:hypothetical protein